jgi:hypothetical protein
MGGGFAPRAGRWRWRFSHGLAVAPLRRRQHGAGVGLLLEHEAPVLPALGAPSHPVRIPSSRNRFSAVATARSHTFAFRADRRIGRVEAATGIVQEVEDQRVEHLQRGVPNGSPVVAWLVRAAVEAIAPRRRPFV